MLGLLGVEDITVGHRLMMHQVQVHGGEDIQYPLEDMNDVKKIINRRFAKRVRAGVTAPQKTNSQFCYFFKSCTFKGLMYAVCPPSYLGHLSLFEEFKVSLKPSWPGPRSYKSGLSAI